MRLGIWYSQGRLRDHSFEYGTERILGCQPGRTRKIRPVWPLISSSKEVTCYLRWRLFYFHEKIFMGVIPAIPTVAMETFLKFFGTDAAQATLFSNHRWSKRFLCSVLASIQTVLGEGDPTRGRRRRRFEINEILRNGSWLPLKLRRKT